MNEASANRNRVQRDIEILREMLEPGDTVYAATRGYSDSGNKIISFYVISKETNKIRNIDGFVARILDYKVGNYTSVHSGVKCGRSYSDEVVSNLGRALFPGGFSPGDTDMYPREKEYEIHDPDGGYALRHESI